MLKDSLLADLDAWAKAQDVSRAEAVRQLVHIGLDAHDRRAQRRAAKS